MKQPKARTVPRKRPAPVARIVPPGAEPKKFVVGTMTTLLARQDENALPDAVAAPLPDDVPASHHFDRPKAHGLPTPEQCCAAPPLTFVLGGARSGKSRHAESLIATLPPPFVYIATAEAGDAEMAERIARHSERRSPDWLTVEAPRDLAGALAAVDRDRPVLVDCLTLWLSNLMLADADVEAHATDLEAALAARPAPVVIVSNEVGHGIVPDNPLARRFRDLQGWLNQRIAARADRVVLMVAGLPLMVKDRSHE